MICLLYSLSLLKNPVHLSTQLLFYLLPQCNLVLGDQSDATGTCIKASALLILCMCNLGMKAPSNS